MRGVYGEPMNAFVRAGLGLLLLVGVHAGCAMSPEERAATEKAWAERDRQRAAECAQFGGRYFAGTCLYGSAQ